jgi:Uma2 family endonuclease
MVDVIAPVQKPISQLQLTPGSLLTIENVTWQEFETILDELGEHRSSRLAYSHGTLEIMVPLPEHEKPTDLISDIVKLLLKATGQRYEPYRSTTFKGNHAGIEPDACFYIQNYQRMIGYRRLEASDPAPDLAIEIDVTSKTTLAAYQALGVQEVWIYTRGALTIYLLQEGQYCTVEKSPTFPQFELTQMIPKAIARAAQVGVNQALEEFEAAI